MFGVVIDDFYLLDEESEVSVIGFVIVVICKVVLVVVFGGSEV